ncbi:MAG: hypothetical protein KA020_03840 [Planctomycetes bacterium]|jgi:hypothetical protein|nr:hypothetical protein [Planctomycetota bacterium]MCC7061476.1 hypothetical protein [Planctomycetota bacterium]
MKLRFLRSFALCAFFGLLAPAVVAQSLQLADGKVLLAEVEGTPDGDGLRVRRLDNGGVLDLRWDHLSPTSALALKRLFDLAGDSQDGEVMERAEEVEYSVSGSRKTIIGKIVERGKEIVVQQKGVLFRIPAGDVHQVRLVDVPATQVFTKDEYYTAKLAAASPGDKADKHALLADELIKFRDYDHALEHLQKAKELGNSLDAARIDRMLARLTLYKEAAKERDLLDQIQAARSRNTLLDYEKGSKLVAQFEKEYPQTRLKPEFELEKKRFVEGRTKFLCQYVADQFRRAIYFVADKKVADESLTLQAARDYAENKMSDELFARIATQVKLDVEEVKKLWAERAKYPKGKSTEHFAYGIGSWILGDAGILKDTEVGKAKDQQKQGAEKEDPNDRDVQRIAKLLKDALQRRNAASRGAGGQQDQQKEQTDEDWWQQASRDERRGWLRAYYAEFGGQLKLTFAAVSPCISCYGQGTTPEMGGDGKMVQMKCFLCHATKWLRSFKAY